MIVSDVTGKETLSLKKGSYRANEVTQLACEAAVQAKAQYVEPEDVVIAMIDKGRGMAAVVFSDLNVNRDALKGAMAKRLEDRELSSNGSTLIRVSEELLASAERARTYSKEHEVPAVGSEHLLYGIASSENGVSHALKDYGITPETIDSSLLRSLSRDQL